MSEIIIFIKRNVLDWQSIKKWIHLKDLILETFCTFFSILIWNSSFFWHWMFYRVLTSLSGLPFNSIFPIIIQLEFPNFVLFKFFEKPSNMPLVFNVKCMALYLLLIWCWLKQKCSGWELNLCASCAIQNKT